MTSPFSRLLRSLNPLLAIRRPPPSSARPHRCLATAAASTNADADDSAAAVETDECIYVKRLGSAATTRDQTSVTMPMSFMTGSIVGKRFYKDVTTRMADDGNGWTVMLDYRTLKTPSKRPLKLQSLALAKAIAAEWDYQVDRWGLVEGGHDVDVADLRVQISSATVLLGLSRLT
ncbi:hypothetical protein BHE74_00001094 [Ensete ventricosum]|nr:hypothetical protein BHE74_00001094 [Ensete ventricosum]